MKKNATVENPLIPNSLEDRMMVKYWLNYGLNNFYKTAIQYLFAKVLKLTFDRWRI